ncbi:hypothetical protein LCGC14_1107190 [marine sediment metagenome]|uniref:Uncharacterized protein n=1 Tax=marine sediment metagenome TaxID=412755 RepID=A0A0F9MVN3_9ZZZZ
MVVKKVVARTFKKSLKIKDLKKAGLKPSDLIKVQDDWDITIKLLNALKQTGPKITDDIDIKELNKLQENISGVFLD